MKMTRLKVAVRVRPLSEREIEAGSVSVIRIDNGDTLSVTNVKVPEQNAGDSRERVRRFTFDRCFDQHDTQDSVFETIEEVIGQSMKQRFHSCILAYGQSSSGKTHTMMGFKEDPGLTPKLCSKVFDYLQEAAVGDELNSMKITVSYLEIYNEKVKDLLTVCDDGVKYSRRRNHSLKVREHPKKGPYVQGLSEHLVYNSLDLLDWLETGNKRRKVAATLSNPKSSRSHAVFSVNCDGVKLNLIDLAGSERAGSRCFNISTFKEGANINKSLVALGNVISALAEQSSKQAKGIRRRFVPYRDSVLTWLLKDILGGNSNTFMVATVSPSNSCYSETVNTLRFGQRAKLIVSRPVVNEDPKEKTIRELRAEIFRLRELLNGIQHPQYLPPNSMIEIRNGATENNIPINDFEKTIQFCDDSEHDITNITTEKLVPLIKFETNPLKTKPTKLRKTFSVDHQFPKMDKFGSNDSLPSTSTKSVMSTPTSSTASSEKSSLLRRRSLNKALPSLPKVATKRSSLEGSLVQKMEKSVSTENLKRITSKVDSLRKSTTTRPRSQIVAAVTSRLYSKAKKKDAATDTLDMEAHIEEGPKELNICNNARKRLQELTRKALKSHRNKNEETQTDLYPVQRVKEISTDSDDLPLILAEVKNVATMSEAVEMKDVAIECSFPENGNRIEFTRSCGTQCPSEDSFGESVERKSHPPISFTKYLRDIQHDLPNNPIYTQAVNINISNNYMNGNKVSSSTSTDSLEPNVGLPTPDLISNHNSLEQASNSKEYEILHETVEELQGPTFTNVSVYQEHQHPIFHIKTETVSDYIQPAPICKLEKSFASQICNNQIQCNEFCAPIPRFVPQTRRAVQVIHENKTDTHYATVKEEPQVLKSIVKENQCDDEAQFKSDLPDSLEYHMVNKKVKFSEKVSQEKRMYKAMTEFLEEATQLMSRIDKYTSNLFENNLEIEVTVNDARCVKNIVKKIRKNVERPRSAVFPSNIERKDNFNQTCEPARSSSYTKCEENFTLPLNRYEALLEETCKRLEEKVRQPSSDYNESFYQDLNNTDVEDSSLAFSDYGSLPRRTHKRYRRPACSPSAFLKQLTNMRKQIIKTSREDLLAGNCNH